jgi:hypothetical protein
MQLGMDGMAAAIGNFNLPGKTYAGPASKQTNAHICMHACMFSLLAPEPVQLPLLHAALLRRPGLHTIVSVNSAFDAGIQCDGSAATTHLTGCEYEPAAESQNPCKREAKAPVR